MAVITRAHPHRDQVRIASGLDTIAGIWLAISAWAVPMTEMMAWNNLILGVLIAIMAATRAFGAYGASGVSWVNVALGFWVLISPWVLNAVTAASGWNAVIVGIVVILLAGWSAIATNTERTVPAEEEPRTPPR
ncbi:MAG: SPW repeat protein [Phycisphaeraceae bacterium]